MIDFNDIDIEEDDGFVFSDIEFESFLIEQGIKDKFIYNCNNNNTHKKTCHTTWGSLETFCEDMNKYNYISGAFDWDGDYWSKIHIKWQKYMFNNYKNKQIEDRKENSEGNQVLQGIWKIKV